MSLYLTVLVASTILLAGCSLPLGPAKAGLQVMTTEVPASIFLNGQYLEKTPYIGKNLKPGEYMLKIQPDNPAFVPYETTITLAKGLLTVVTWKPGERPETSGGVIYEMESLSQKNKTELSIISIPDKAIVSLDQDKKDFTPLLLKDVAIGTHEFEVRLPSYETQKHTINIIEGYRINITVKLAKHSLELVDGKTDQEASPSAKTVDTEESTASGETPLRQAKSTVSETDQPMVTIKPTNFYRDGKEVLRVRDKAGSHGQELGFAEVGESYPYLDETVSGWHKIDFAGDEGWVSGKYASLDVE